MCRAPLPPFCDRFLSISTMLCKRPVPAPLRSYHGPPTARSRPNDWVSTLSFPYKDRRCLRCHTPPLRCVHAVYHLPTLFTVSPMLLLSSICPECRRYNLHFPNHQCPHHLRVPLVTPRTAPSNQSTIPFTVTSRWQSSALGSSPICSLVPNIPRLRAICRRNFLILLHTHSIERNCTLP